MSFEEMSELMVLLGIIEEWKGRVHSESYKESDISNQLMVLAEKGGPRLKKLLKNLEDRGRESRYPLESAAELFAKLGDASNLRVIERFEKQADDLKSYGFLKRMLDRGGYRKKAIERGLTLDVITESLQAIELRACLEKYLPKANEVFRSCLSTVLSKTLFDGLRPITMEDVTVGQRIWSRYPFKREDGTGYTLWLDDADFKIKRNGLWKLKCDTYFQLKGFYDLAYRLFCFMTHKNSLTVRLDGNVVTDPGVEREEPRALIKWLSLEAVRELWHRRSWMKHGYRIADNYVLHQLMDMSMKPNCTLRGLAYRVVKGSPESGDGLMVDFLMGGFGNGEDYRLFRRNTAVIESPQVLTIVGECRSRGMDDEETIDHLADWLESECRSPRTATY